MHGRICRGYPGPGRSKADSPTGQLSSRRARQLTLARVPQWFIEHVGGGGSAEIRGVQMVYLVKGSRKKDEADNTYKTTSPLLRGNRRIRRRG